jgi:hypothetical protein
MLQPNDHEITELLNQILNSSEFHDSKKSQELLKYLVERSSKVTSLKETEIACDVFGKDTSFDPSIDSLIRSYISNLRKKLEHYYLTTENKFNYKIEIPRGQYLVKYIKADHGKNSTSKLKINKSFIYLSIIAVLAILLVWKMFGTNSNTAYTQQDAVVNPVWAEFLEKNSYPTLFILGDYLVMTEKGRPPHRTFLRDPRINSEKDLQNYVIQNQGLYGNYEISENSFVGSGLALSLSNLFQLFGSKSSQVSFRLSSQLKWQDLDNNNIVFIGPFKCLYKLDTLFSRLNIRYKLNPSSLSILNSDQKDTMKILGQGVSYKKDFSVISKIMGNKNKSIIFLTGFSELGIINSIKTATEPDLLMKIKTISQNDLNQKPLQFEMILEAEGVQHTVIRSQIKYFNLLKNKQ